MKPSEALSLSLNPELGPKPQTPNLKLYKPLNPKPLNPTPKSLSPCSKQAPAPAAPSAFGFLVLEPKGSFRDSFERVPEGFLRKELGRGF